tara:strand:- start:347 stop:673 length:327 start_codon:yes stop_codon:yes gene_type:complete
MANSGYEQSLNLLDHIERGLTVPLPIKALEKILAHHIIILESIVHETVEKANLNAQKIDRVIYVGGSSMMTIVLKNMKILFPTAQDSFANVFTAVAEGLAIASNRIAQ